MELGEVVVRVGNNVEARSGVWVQHSIGWRLSVVMKVWERMD